MSTPLSLTHIKTAITSANKKTKFEFTQDALEKFKDLIYTLLEIAGYTPDTPRPDKAAVNTELTAAFYSMAKSIFMTQRNADGSYECIVTFNEIDYVLRQEARSDTLTIYNQQSPEIKVKINDLPMIKLRMVILDIYVKQNAIENINPYLNAFNLAEDNSEFKKIIVNAYLEEQRWLGNTAIDLSEFNLNDLDLFAFDFSNVALNKDQWESIILKWGTTGITLREVDLSETNLSNMDLSKLDLSLCRMKGANFAGAKLYGTKLNRSGIIAALETRLPDRKDRHIDLRNVIVHGELNARLGSYEYLNLNSINFSKVDLRGSSFNYCEGDSDLEEDLIDNGAHAGNIKYKKSDSTHIDSDTDYDSIRIDAEEAYID